MNTLTEKEAGILYMRWIQKKTLKDVGKAYGLSPERIRQLEAKAIEKLWSIGNLQYLNKTAEEIKAMKAQVRENHLRVCKEKSHGSC